MGILSSLGRRKLIQWRHWWEELSTLDARTYLSSQVIYTIKADARFLAREIIADILPRTRYQVYNELYRYNFSYYGCLSISFSEGVSLV
jgi:hypothetical protein